jgi:hypothetical protein
MGAGGLKFGPGGFSSCAEGTRSEGRAMPGLYDDETVDLLQALAANPRLELVGNERPEAGIRFQLVSDYRPSGDQPQAISELIEGVEGGAKDQVLLGVTGSGKTFTMAHVIA